MSKIESEALGYVAIACRLSVRLFVTLVDRISWKSWKLQLHGQ